MTDQGMTELQQAEAILFAKSMLANLVEPANSLAGALYAARIAFDEGDADQAQQWLGRMLEAMGRFQTISLEAQAEGIRRGYGTASDSADVSKT